MQNEIITLLKNIIIKFLIKTENKEDLKINLKAVTENTKIESVYKDKTLIAAVCKTLVMQGALLTFTSST